MNLCNSPYGMCMHGEVCEREDRCMWEPLPNQKRSLPTFEEAWKKKEAEGYQYGEDALEQVRFGWEIRAKEEMDAKYRTVPAHVTEAIDEKDVTDEDRALVKDFYDNACHAEWCEFDEMMLLYAVTRSRLNAERRRAKK